MRARGDRSHRAEGAAEYRRHGPRPGRVVVVGPDHFHGNFYDVMPPFSLGVEQAVGFGDFGSRSGPLPVAAELAWSVHSGLSAAGFDLALSYSLTVDHGIVQGYEMITAGCSVPMVPLVVNTAAPPLPALERCVALGVALGDAIERSSFGGRVLVVASAGSRTGSRPTTPATRRSPATGALPSSTGGETRRPSPPPANRASGPWEVTRRRGSTRTGTAGSFASWPPPTSTR